MLAPAVLAMLGSARVFCFDKTFVNWTDFFFFVSPAVLKEFRHVGIINLCVFIGFLLFFPLKKKNLRPCFS